MLSRVNQHKAFGLMEVMFSTAIFIVVVGSMVSLSRLALRNATLSIHRAQATNLAQDGLEAVRQLRDTAWIDGDGAGEATADWLELATDCGPSSDYTKIELNVEYEVCQSGTLGLNKLGLRRTTVACDGGTIPANPRTCIQFTDDTGKLEAGAPAAFRRTIRFSAVPGTDTSTNFTGLQLLDAGDDAKPTRFIDAEVNNVIKVHSSVSWTDFDRPWSVSIDTLLTNWKGQ